MLKRRGVVVIIFIIFLGGFFYFRHVKKWAHTFHITFLNIGQGDATLINFDNGQKMLVDCGPDKSVLARLSRALPLWDRTIDYLLITHPDLDHYGGCVDVLRRYKIKKIITNGRSKPNDRYWEEVESAMRNEPAERVTMASATVWTIAGDTLEFISPDPNLVLDVKSDDSNNYSIAFKIQHKDLSFLLTGDMEEPLEKALLKKYCAPFLKDASCPSLAATVLKVGHHGSNSSSGSEFLNSVKPQTAVISVGKNRYGHPSPRVIKRLERAGATILRTDELGDIMLK